MSGKLGHGQLLGQQQSAPGRSPSPRKSPSSLGGGPSGSKLNGNMGQISMKVIFGDRDIRAAMPVELDFKGFLLVLQSLLRRYHEQLEDVFTVKWMDDDGDPCTIGSDLELQEAIRLMESTREPQELTLYVFRGRPARPGTYCDGENRLVYRRGAKRWQKIYAHNGHYFRPTRFHKTGTCQVCGDLIWGLGRQGCCCDQCRRMVHKRCFKLVGDPCPGCSTKSLENDLKPRSHSSGNSGDWRTLPRLLFRRHDSLPESEKRLREQQAARDGPPANSHPTAPSLNETQYDLSHGQNMLDKFELLKVIGRGSYAKVLLVEQKETRRVYALKVIKKSVVNEDEDIEWVHTEKHVFEIATNQPFLVGLHSCFQTMSHLFFVIEFVGGGDLMFHMQMKKRLSEDHARFYAAEITIALNFLHMKGIIYRDLKLDNVLLDSEGHVKLTDYGMCKENMFFGSKTSTFCGTPNYIAPEILRGEEYGHSVDWWALGVLMYEMMAGRSPFELTGQEMPEQNTEDYLFQVILEKTIRIPRFLSVKAAGVLKGFLNKDPLNRLGCNPETGFADIVKHSYFRPLDFDVLAQREVSPPYKPSLRGDRDLNYFDPDFTNQPVCLTPADEEQIRRIDQSEFEGFEYVNPLLMSREDTV